MGGGKPGRGYNAAGVLSLRNSTQKKSVLKSSNFIYSKRFPCRTKLILYLVKG